MKEDVFTCDYLSVDNEKRKVFIDEEEIHLTPIEFRILNLLIANRGKVLTHHYIMDEIWGMESESDDNTINVHINRLRKRFEAYPEFTIETIRGLGYKAVKNV